MGTTSYANDIVTGPTTIEAHDCASCGVVFGLSAGFVERRRKDGRGFYCPNGHTLSWKAAVEDDRLKRRVASLESQLIHTRDQAEAAERSRRAYKGHATRIKNRIRNGVCPCCTRSFENVRRHIADQHPDFVVPE